jgi:Na+-driven multidrug efflux pump
MIAPVLERNRRATQPRPIFIATLWAVASWLFFRPAAAGLAPHVSIQICSSLTDVLQLAKFGFFGAFAGKVLEEAVKAAFFFFRFCSTRWYAHGLKEAGEKLKKE